MTEVIEERKIAPSIYMAGRFFSQPLGIILHSSRSSATQNTPLQEYHGTANYAIDNPDHLCWNATIGPNIYAVHLISEAWGWNAREHSSKYLAVEFAQPTVNDPITDEQVSAFCAWHQKHVLPVWPDLTLDAIPLPAHSELPAGKRDGKTDPFPNGDARITDLRKRIRAYTHPDNWQEAIEHYYNEHADILGAKRFAGELNRADWGGRALFCQRGLLVYRDGNVTDQTERMIDDAITFNDNSHTIVRY